MKNIDKRELYNYLKENGIAYLYHANTVTTSLTFIKNNALLSREYIEKNNLKQTDQESDEKDKYYNIYDNIFLDTCDFHSEELGYSRENKYGPVLFEFNLEILLDPEIKFINITKSNPTNWNNGNKEDFLLELTEYKGSQIKSYNKMLIITVENSRIDLKKHLNSIYLDKDVIVKGKNYSEEGKKILDSKLKENGFKECKNHICKSKCFCLTNYKEKYSKKDLENKFLIK